MRNAVLLLAGLAILAGVVLLFGVTHGHVDEPLEVTVRVVDASTGKPLPGAVVATVRYRQMLDHRESFEERLRYAREHSDGKGWFGHVCAARTTAAATTVIQSSVYVTRFWLLGVRTSKEVHVPQLLVIDEPRHVVPIVASIEAGDAENTWRVDLGTVRVPSGGSAAPPR